MSRFTQLCGAAAATALLSVALSPIAHAEDPPADGPCATESQQVAKAEDALARVTAVFERQKDKVKDAEADVADADSAAEQTKAEKALDKAKAKKEKTKKAKKAQLQRLAKARERLAECEAAQTS